MTREEAIAHGKEQLEVFSGEHAEFIKLAIEALKQAPCEDAISRKAVLDYQQYLYGKMPNDENFKLYEFIQALPPVTPERKTGKWITNSDFPDEIICSCCNTNYDMWFWEQGTMNYCPHCGAEMEE